MRAHRQSVHACKFCAWSTCLGDLQILVLGFCDNQRDEELIWKILSQVLSAVFFMHVYGGMSMPIMLQMIQLLQHVLCMLLEPSL